MIKHSFWRCGRGSSDSVFWVSIYGSNHREKLWFKLTIEPLWRIGCALHRARLWVLYRTHPRHKFHLVDTGLKPGYYDQDILILHACMSLLGNYIKWHGGLEDLDRFSRDLRAHPDQNAPEGLDASQADQQDEATAIYRWWTIERPQAHAAHKQDGMRVFGRESKPLPGEADAYHNQDLALDAKDQEMLHRLIDIRPGLWT